MVSTAASIVAAGVFCGVVASGGDVAIDGASIADDAFVFVLLVLLLLRVLRLDDGYC